MTDAEANSGDIAVNATLNLNAILGDAPAEVKEMVALSMALSACMAAQNEVTAQQEKSLLNLALLASEVFKLAVPPHSAVESFLAEEIRLADPFAPVLARFKTASEQYRGASETTHSVLNQRNLSKGGEANVPPRPLDPNNYRAASLVAVYQAVADALALSTQNAVATQQALNTLGSPVLASAVDMILSLAVKDPSGASRESAAT